jgi:predicted transcriptional regulator
MKTKPQNGLTPTQRKHVGKFLDLFADVEVVLKKRLNLRSDDRKGVKVLINDYETKNHYWKESAHRLRQLAEIRNLLTHQRSEIFGYPVAVTGLSVEVLSEIKEHLLRPQRVSHFFCCEVKSVGPEDNLALVVALAFENGFSQFPVIEGGVFRGLVTENEIIRWLGRRARANVVEVDLREVCVGTVLKQKDPTMKGMSIFGFERLDKPVEEVMARFSTETTLEVVLLTKSGNNSAPIEGIVTQWDAARYPQSPIRLMK